MFLPCSSVRLVLLIVERGPGTIAVQEAVRVLRAVYVRPYDLARSIDAVRKGAVDPQGVVERGPSTAIVEEPVVVAGAVDVRPNDLARSIDAICEGAVDR